MVSSLLSGIWKNHAQDGKVPYMAKEPTGTLDVAERLIASREALKLSQAALCRSTGISTAAWNNAETGDARIGLDNAILLCQATGLTLDWIFRGVRTGLPGGINEAIGKYEAEQRKSVRQPVKLHKQRPRQV